MAGAVVCRTGTLRAGWRAGAVPRSWRHRGFVGVVRGAGRRGLACAVVCFYICIDVLFCILDVF